MVIMIVTSAPNRRTRTGYSRAVNIYEMIFPPRAKMIQDSKSSKEQSLCSIIETTAPCALSSNTFRWRCCSGRILHGYKIRVATFFTQKGKSSNSIFRN